MASWSGEPWSEKGNHYPVEARVLGRLPSWSSCGRAN